MSQELSLAKKLRLHSEEILLQRAQEERNRQQVMFKNQELVREETEQIILVYETNKAKTIYQTLVNMIKVENEKGRFNVSLRKSVGCNFGEPADNVCPENVGRILETLLVRDEFAVVWKVYGESYGHGYRSFGLELQVSW